MAKPLTDQQQEEYLENHGLKCPHCGSENLNVGTLDADGPDAHAEVSCESCGERWVDVYTLIGIEEVDH